MWQIQNKKTGKIREWSNNPDSPGFQGKFITHDRDADGLYPPERLLAPDEWGNVEWVDIAPDWSHTTGTEIRIQHSYGLQTVYYHTTPSIGENLQVNQGDLLGVTANTGYSTGVHLHYTLEFSYGKTTIALNPLVPPAQIAHLPLQDKEKQMKHLLIRRMLVQVTLFGVSIACCVTACVPLSGKQAQDIVDAESVKLLRDLLHQHLN